MLQWLKDLYNGANGVLTTIERWVVGAINVVYSYFSALISQLWTGLQSLANAVNKFVGEVELSLYNLYTQAQWIITKGIPQLANWVLNELNKLGAYIYSVYNWAVKELAWLETWAQNELTKLTEWVLKNVWDPLWNAITSAVKWIETEGAYVYYLLTHPDQLAAILGAYLLREWTSLGRKYAKPFVKWLFHSMIAEIPSVSSVIEDIIASLF